MKALRSLLALCGAVLSATFAVADSLDLETEYYYTDSTEPNLSTSSDTAATAITPSAWTTISITWTSTA